MKVNDPNSNSVNGGAVGPADRAGHSSSIRKTGIGGRYDAYGDESPDRVALSDLSTQVRNLSFDSPEHTARLERLSADVRAGRYQVDARALSQSLVEQSLKPKE